MYVGIRDCEPKLIICSSVGLEGMNKVRYTYTYIHTFLFHSTRALYILNMYTAYTICIQVILYKTLVDEAIQQCQSVYKVDKVHTYDVYIVTTSI